MLNALAWKAVAAFATARAESARKAHGPGPIEESGGTVTLRIGPGVGTITADAEIDGRVSWKAFALLLASKVNASTLAAVVADYNAGHRPGKPTDYAVASAVAALDVGTAVRKGSIRSTHAPAVLVDDAVTLAG